jgi:hypothetical protein
MQNTTVRVPVGRYLCASHVVGRGRRTLSVRVGVLWGRRVRAGHEGPLRWIWTTAVPMIRVVRRYVDRALHAHVIVRIRVAISGVN